VQLQKVPLDFTFGRMVSGQGNVGRDEVQVDRTRLQPDGAPQQSGQRLTQPLTLGGGLQPGRLAVLLLFNVLPDVYVLHHGADAFAHRLVVQVAVGDMNDGRLGRSNKKRIIKIKKIFKRGGKDICTT